MAASAGDDADTTLGLPQYLDLANYVYTSGQDPSAFPTKIGYAPLKYNGQLVSSLDSKTGFYGQAFISTNTPQPNVIIAFEGTNLKHNPPNLVFQAAQVDDDYDIFKGRDAPSFESALTFTQTAIKDAEADHVAASSIYLAGHSLGGAEAEYVAAKLDLPGTTFGAPGISSSDFSPGVASKLTNYVDYGDPVGNYSADAPTALGSIVQSSSILHYGGQVYTGVPDHRTLLTDILNDYIQGDISDTLKNFSYGFTYNHALSNYASDLGATLDKDDSSTGSDFGFFVPLFGYFGATACFASGTRIQTARGDVAVEHLSMEDCVITASGELRPVRWLGHRSIDCRRHPRPLDVWPVRLAAHAFGWNRPARDLLVSPGHAICVDVEGEILVPAASLINGTSIEQIAVDVVTYWHVELESHDILLAENLPAESYLEMGNRGFFAEAEAIALQAVPDVPKRPHADFCRPMVVGGPLVAAVRARLAQLALRTTQAARIRDPLAEARCSTG